MRPVSKRQPKTLKPGRAVAIAVSARKAIVILTLPAFAVNAWDMPSQEPRLATLDGHEKHVNALALSPRGDLLATASRDRTVRLWDVASCTEHIRLRGHTNSVNAVAFTPDGKTLVTADADGNIRLWQIDELFKGDMDEVKPAG
jgi:WD40 repeat protein